MCKSYENNNERRIETNKQGALEKSEITSIEIPKSVENIDTHAFSSCKKLRDIKLNEGLKSIKDRVFSETAITTIIISLSVEEVDRYVFENCNRLTKINCRAVGSPFPEKWNYVWNKKSNSAEAVYKVKWEFKGE